LAPLIQQEVFDVIQKLRGINVSILLVEQNARKALEISDRSYVMEIGEICLEGNSSVVLKDPQVEKSYLGG
jgi:branched-chain amino acid transport system ATP-binding protein